MRVIVVRRLGPLSYPTIAKETHTSNQSVVDPAIACML